MRIQNITWSKFNKTKRKAITVFAFTSLIAFTLILSLTTCSNKTKSPNIVIIYTDDQGYADVGTYGAKGFTTPHLDKMAEEGMRFTNFYVSQAVC